MNGPVHRITAYTALLAVAATKFPTMQVHDYKVYPIAGLLVVGAAGTLADMDIEGSTYGHKYPTASKIFSHRGVTHTVAATSIFYLMMLMATGSYGSIAASLLYGVAVGGTLQAYLVYKAYKSHMKNAAKVLKKTGLLIGAALAAFMYLIMTIAPDNVNEVLISFILSILFGWLFGYGVHVFADIWNGKGCPLLWPLLRRRIHICRVTTGTYQEYVFCFLWVVFCIVHVICVKGGFTV